MPTVMTNLQMLGFPQDLARTGQLAAAAVAAILVWRTWRRPSHPFGVPVVLAGTCLATPHAFIYDLPMLSSAVVLFAAHRLRSTASLFSFEIAVSVFVLTFPVTMTLRGVHAPVSTVAVSLFFVLFFGASKAVGKQMQDIGPIAQSASSGMPSWHGRSYDLPLDASIEHRVGPTTHPPSRKGDIIAHQRRLLPRLLRLATSAQPGNLQPAQLGILFGRHSQSLGGQAEAEDGSRTRGRFRCGRVRAVRQTIPARCLPRALHVVQGQREQPVHGCSVGCALPADRGHALASRRPSRRWGVRPLSETGGGPNARRRHNPGLSVPFTTEVRTFSIK